MNDGLDIEFLLEQWGLWAKGGVGLCMGFGADKAGLACRESDVEMIDWAVGQIGLHNPRRKSIIRHKYLCCELDDNGCSVPISDGMTALHFRTTEGDIRSELNVAFNDIEDLISGSVERRRFR